MILIISFFLSHNWRYKVNNNQCALPHWTFPSCDQLFIDIFFHLCFSQDSTHTPLSAAKLTWINFSIKISWDSVKCFTKNPNICQLPYWDFFWFYLFDFFFSHSFCLKLILHTKTSTTLPCLDHFGLVLVKSRSVCVPKTHPAQGVQNMKRLFSPSLCSGWGELNQGFLPKSSLRFPLLSIILIHTARKHLLSIPFHTQSSRLSCNSTHWFLCQWEKSSPGVCGVPKLPNPGSWNPLPQRVQRSEFIQSHCWTLILLFWEGLIMLIVN